GGGPTSIFIWSPGARMSAGRCLRGAARARFGHFARGLASPMRGRLLGALVVCVLAARAWSQDPASGPVIVVETSKGTFEFETYPNDAPKTVAHVVELVTRGFYNGQRFHRAIPGFVVQWGDPQSRDPGRQGDWGRGDLASSGQPIGVTEITKKRSHVRGAVGVAHAGNPTRADSQIYVTLADRP